jgi:phosphopantothenoylcysteine decarboxylase/phosphopantothenate--cysteine ligase
MGHPRPGINRPRAGHRDRYDAHDPLHRRGTRTLPDFVTNPTTPVPRRLLITAGPTHEPIDAVRYLGNRSSGRLGVALADAAVRRGWTVTLLLGPTPRMPSDSRVRLHRFRTTADLEGLLATHLPHADVLVMAAAVADFRPRVEPGMLEGKHRRSKDGMALTLDPTPDLLAGCAARRRPGQVLIGFALEPRERLLASAREKLQRKGVDAIIANPLETMDGDTIEAVMVLRNGTDRQTEGAVGKDQFAGWLLDALDGLASGGHP